MLPSSLRSNENLENHLFHVLKFSFCATHSMLCDSSTRLSSFSRCSSCLISVCKISARSAFFTSNRYAAGINHYLCDDSPAIVPQKEPTLDRLLIHFRTIGVVASFHGWTCKELNKCREIIERLIKKWIKVFKTLIDHRSISNCEQLIKSNEIFLIFFQS